MACEIRLYCRTGGISAVAGFEALTLSGDVEWSAVWRAKSLGDVVPHDDGSGFAPGWNRSRRSCGRGSTVP
ncbi:hypothetical protein [Amycolatopsis sp. GA6-003]|uniref:hypothetical protein n=1 Tax=Amycolatopsis sp. GA6-003 TaxID=2652444 RepID=UPI0039173BE4